MVGISLKKLIRKEKLLAVLERAIATLEATVTIRDAKGKIILGKDDETFTDRYPIQVEEEIIGWVTGNNKTILIAELLSYTATQEVEKKTLALDTLYRYEELNFLYDFSSRIASCLKVKEVSELIVDEARKLISATSASVMLRNEETDCLEIISARGKEYKNKTIMCAKTGIAGHILVSGKAEIINDVSCDRRFVQGENQVHSLICAPLKTKKGIIGVINISNSEPVNYSAQDLKLFSALTAQAASAIENALLHENMLKEERLKSNLERYLSPQLVEAALSSKGRISLEPTKRNITVLFSDIRDFTAKCEELPAEKIVTYLNEYFTQMVSVIFQHQGTVNKFVGDMIVTMFGAPSELESPEKRAIQAAIAMQRQLDAIEIPWIRDNFLTGIGISSGEVVVGNIGSPQHMDYTAIGDEVNIASRLQSIAEGRQILVSDSVYNATKNFFQFRPLGCEIVKGKKKAVTIFEVIY